MKKTLYRFRYKKILVSETTKLDLNTPVVVTIEGGLGAQIIAAFVYFDLLEKGYDASADLSYFDQCPKLVNPSTKHSVSIWPWELDNFGLQKSSFKKKNTKKALCYFIPDGRIKGKYFFMALKNTKVKKFFPNLALSALSDKVSLNQNIQFQKPFACIHIRRGDYINISFHLITDEEFFLVSKKISGLANRLVVVSDAPISKKLSKKFSKLFKDVIVLDSSKTSTYLTHCIMRHAKILICSNSQFSLSAGVLSSEEGITLIPKTWFTSHNHLELQKATEGLSSFAILD